MGITVGKGFEDTLMKGMAVLQTDRFHSMQELIDSFSGVGQSTHASVPPTPAPVPTQPEKPKKKKKSPVGLIIGIIVTLLIVGLIGGGGYYLWYNGYLDDLLYGPEDTEESTDTISIEPTEPTDPGFSLDEAEDKALEYIDAYFAPDSEKIDALSVLTYGEVVSYNAYEEGKTVDAYMTEDLGVSNMNELYGAMDDSDRSDYAEQYGEDYTYTMSITETVVYDDAQLAELIDQAKAYGEENYPGMGYIETDGITCACDVHVKYTVSGSKLSEDYDAVVLMVYSYGEWLVLN